MKTEEHNINSYLSFELGKEMFAANVAKVINILEMLKITKVPQAPDYMLGVINLRGSVLPLVDLRLKFGLPGTEYTSKTCILVLSVHIDSEEVLLGGLVDAVHEVIEIHPDKANNSPKIGNRYKNEFISGMYKLDDEKFIMILDMDMIFSTDELIQLKKEITEKANTETKI